MRFRGALRAATIIYRPGIVQLEPGGSIIDRANPRAQRQRAPRRDRLLNDSPVPKRYSTEVFMKKALLALLLALMWAGGQSPALAQSKNAQSQNKIIDRHRKAIGGSEVKRVRTTVLEGAVERDGAS